MRVLGIIVTAGMMVAIAHGLASGDLATWRPGDLATWRPGDLATEGSAIVDVAWGRVRLADIYREEF